MTQSTNIVTFGKYKGKPVSEVPEDYKEWVLENVTNPAYRALFEEPKTHYDHIIFGKSQEENIVSIDYLEETNNFEVWKSDGTSEIIDYSPWLLSYKPLEGSHSLKGSQYYKYKLDITGREYLYQQTSWDRSIFVPRNIEECIMLEMGYTYYKGMDYKDLNVLSFDIEATSLDGRASNAEVLLISNTFRDEQGEINKTVFDIKNYESETALILAWNDYVRDVDPDVIMGHNIFGYDLPYLANRAEANSIDLFIGRDGSALKFEDRVSKKRKDSQQQYEFHNAKANGREFIDTMFLAITYDVPRDFPSYGLKQIEKHLKLVDDSRIEWDFNKYRTNEYLEWPEGKWEEFVKYCEDDGDSPLKMFDIMIPPYFYMCQSMPKTMQQMINEATGSQIDSFMIRSYMQELHSLPKTTQKEEYQGAISFGIPGNYTNVFSVDFASLYPSIMIQYDVYDREKDPEGNFIYAVKYFTDYRFKNKKLYKDTKEEIYNHIQASAKIWINSAYGHQGAGYLLFNSPKNADFITAKGRELLNTICKVATGKDIYEWKKEIEK